MWRRTGNDQQDIGHVLGMSNAVALGVTGQSSHGFLCGLSLILHHYEGDLITDTCQTARAVMGQTHEEEG